MLVRRDIIRSGLIGGAALAVPGCVTLPQNALSKIKSTCNTISPVKVSQDRIIRTVAGLRPYRASGFVVRKDKFAEKIIIHNYGHGGAGITLSWGTSRLAVDLALPSQNSSVAVMGSGIVGLTTARLLQEEGFQVTVYAEQFPPHTTSNIAGGQWSPYSAYKTGMVSDEWMSQFDKALEYSWRRFQIMTGEDYGVRWVTTFVDSARSDPSREKYQSAAQILNPKVYPFPVEELRRFKTMYIETGRFLRELTKDIQIAGGKFVRKRFNAITDIAALPETLVFNCTGLGSRALFNDMDMHPVRGQLAILLPQPEIDYAFLGSMGYMFPRPDGIFLGGTQEHDIWDATPQPDDISRIVASHKNFFDSFTCSA